MEKNLILFDDASWHDLLPLTFTRPIAKLRAGILTMEEKWQRYFSTFAGYLTQEYLTAKYPMTCSSSEILYVNAKVFPSESLVKQIKLLTKGEALKTENVLLAVCLGASEKLQIETYLNRAKSIEFVPQMINHPYDIFRLNGIAIEDDFSNLTKDRKSKPLSSTNTLLGSNIFIEEGAIVECCILNSNTGPIYIGKDAEIMEGAIIRGPFALCEHSQVKMAAKIYGPTTIGPYSRVGGEVNNSVIQGFSNKAHDGFLGNSVIGEWCNLGADTNNSNLKNNYASVKLWNYVKESFVDTKLQFCGLIMGDHSKCGINTMFNTGTVVGVSANIFGDGFPRNFIPSFSWGGAQGFSVFQIPKAFEVMEKAMGRRNHQLTESDKEMFKHIFEFTSKYRRF